MFYFLNILLITDDDKLSRYGNDYYSKSYISRIDVRYNEWKYSEISSTNYVTKYNRKQRGAELSDILNYNGKLYTFGDKTGIAFELDMIKTSLIPKMIFNEKDGNKNKPMKIEWATVKGNEMVIGSHGNTHEDDLEDYSKSYVYYINEKLEHRTESWIDKYNFIHSVLNVTKPEGYVTHEAVLYSNMYNEWYFFPRKVSYEAYDDNKDPYLSSEYIVICNENITECRKYKDPQFTKGRCFSSIKVIPFDERIVIYTKSVEIDNLVETYIGALSFENVKENENATIVMKEVKISDYKIEGIEIINE